MGKEPSDGEMCGRPFNSTLNTGLRRLELLFFCGLVFAACAVMTFRGVQFLCDGYAFFPLAGVCVPWPAGIAAAVFLFALSAAIALANAAMLIRFFRA